MEFLILFKKQLKLRTQSLTLEMHTAWRERKLKKLKKEYEEVKEIIKKHLQ